MAELFMLVYFFIGPAVAIGLSVLIVRSFLTERNDI
jgi:hypothetical protein